MSGGVSSTAPAGTPVNFTGRTSTTDNGVPYKKTNAGKVIMVGANIVGTGAVLGLASKYMSTDGTFKGLCDNFVKSEYFAKAKNPKTAAIATAVGIAVVSLGTMLGIGALIDKAANNKQRKKAEENAAAAAAAEAQVQVQA